MSANGSSGNLMPCADLNVIVIADAVTNGVGIPGKHDVGIPASNGVNGHIGGIVSNGGMSAAGNNVVSGSGVPIVVDGIMSDSNIVANSVNVASPNGGPNAGGLNVPISNGAASGSGRPSKNGPVWSIPNGSNIHVGGM